MSDESDEKPAESDEEPETAAETPTPDADTDGSGGPVDERPALEPDEKADFSFSLEDVDPEAVEGPAADESDETADTTDSESDESEDTDDSDDADSDDVSGESWGDMYVDVLGIVLVAVVDEYGDDGDLEKSEVVELANEPPIALNEQADRLFEQMGGTKDLPPGQALAVGSATVAGSVLLRETDVAGQIAGELTDSEVLD